MATRLNRGIVLAVVAGAALVGLMLGCGTSASGTGSTRTESTTFTAHATTSSGATTASQTRGRKPPVTTRRGPPVAAMPTIGHRTKSSGCRIRAQLPDPACTPGGVFAQATVSQICTRGYSESVRDVPETIRREVYAGYGIASGAPGSYELDHLIPLELGGDNTIANLWPEASPGYHAKDTIEDNLHDAVCAGAVSLRTAQQEIAHDWRRTAVGAPSTAPARGTTAPLSPPSPTTSPPRSSGSGASSSTGSTQVVHPGAFCAPVGAQGVTSRGTPMKCTTTATDTRARWRRSR
jgi:hypothetical protein